MSPVFIDTLLNNRANFRGRGKRKARIGEKPRAPSPVPLPPWRVINFDNYSLDNGPCNDKR